MLSRRAFSTPISWTCCQGKSQQNVYSIFGELSQAMRLLPQDGEVVKSDCPDHSIQYLHVHRYLSKLVYLLDNSPCLSSLRGIYIILFLISFIYNVFNFL